MLFSFVKRSIILFIIPLSLAFLSMCSMPQVRTASQTTFYQALLLESSHEFDSERVKLFEKSLASSNEYIRQAAAGELAALMVNGSPLSPRTTEMMRREASGLWAAAFDIAPFNLMAIENKPPDKKKAFSFLLGPDHDSFYFDESRLYILKECEKQPDFFTEKELAAIEGHYAVYKLRYNEGLDRFRVFQEEGKWTDKIPQVFLEYPNLINDLGRAFQYTQTNKEGLDLFIKWETNLPGSVNNNSDDIRFRLLFYAGRIARRIGGTSSTQAVSLFEKSFALAPDYEQQDACIWYILDSSLTGPVNVIMERMEKYIPQWYSGSYFNQVMERYLHRLVSAKDWRRVIRTFDLIKDVNAPIPKTGYAYVIARAIEEGYLSAEEKRLAAKTLNQTSADASDFMRIAYNQGVILAMPAIYYRMQTADALGLPYLEFSEDAADRKSEASPVLQFLLGFFRNNAEEYAIPYIKLHESKLTPSELRAVAQALDNAGIHTESMRIIALYIHKDGYVKNRRDLELMYPRPYLELIEMYSEKFALKPSLFFGLVRCESAFQKAIVSHAGAVGLSQLMPSTAREQAKRIRDGGGPDFLGPNDTVDSTDPDTNLYIGTFYLSHHNNNFGDMYLALMAYNGGHNRVRRWYAATDLPMDLFLETVSIYETRDYGKRVTAIGRIYDELYYKNR